MSWDTVIDPCFFTTDARISNSSTPANALTLLELRSLPPLLKDNAEKKDQQITESQSDNGEGEPKRLCTVKGCKAMIGVSYEFKMCPPCRTRYRIYGRTKRAKWKMEREAFELEMSALRVLEDEGRKKEGLDVSAPANANLCSLSQALFDCYSPCPKTQKHSVHVNCRLSMNKFKHPLSPFKWRRMERY